jgi:hypothetical protein
MKSLTEIEHRGIPKNINNIMMFKNSGKNTGLGFSTYTVTGSLTCLVAKN